MNFFAEAPALHNFLDFDQAEAYRAVPADWWIVLTDIRGSTAAVAEGRFKEVNMAGAACVAAIAKGPYGLNLPFVFGGDGATILIPPDYREEALSKMKATQAVIQGNYGLELRVGCLNVGDIAKDGFDFQVARYQLPAGPCIAFMKGSGFDEAERRIKAGQGLISSTPEDIEPDLLEGLSCRWAPVKNERGTILTILVKEQPHCQDPKVVEKVARRIHQIVDLGAPITHPIKQRMKYEHMSLWKAISLERRLRNQPFLSKFTLRVIFEMLFVEFALRWGFKNEKVDMREYALHVNEHSDHKKYDSTLRMVIDCSPQMATEIRDHLESLYQQGLIHYGLHESEDALLTCYAESTQFGKHIHFVDGGSGGYTSAAKQLKKQIKNAQTGP